MVLQQIQFKIRQVMVLGTSSFRLLKEFYLRQESILPPSNFDINHFTGQDLSSLPLWGAKDNVTIRRRDAFSEVELHEIKPLGEGKKGTYLRQHNWYLLLHSQHSALMTNHNCPSERKRARKKKERKKPVYKQPHNPWLLFSLKEKEINKFLALG